MVSVAVVCVLVACGFLAVVVLVGGLVFMRHRVLVRRRHAALATRTRMRRSELPEALPPDENAWNAPPADGTVLIRTAEDLRRLNDLVRVEAVSDDVQSTDEAMTRENSHTFRGDFSHNVSMFGVSTPSAGGSAQGRVGASMDATPLHSLTGSRVWPRQMTPKRSPLHIATDLVVSSDAGHPKSPWSPSDIPPLPATVPAAASLPPTFPQPQSSTTDVRTPFQKNQVRHSREASGGGAPTHEALVAAASVPAMTASPSAFQMPPGSLATGAVDHFQSASLTADRAAVLLNPSNRPLFSRSSVVPLLSEHFVSDPPPPAAHPQAPNENSSSLSPSMSTAFASHGVFNTTPMVLAGKSPADIEKLDDADGAKSASVSFAFVGSADMSAGRQQQSEQIARRLLVPMLERAADITAPGASCDSSGEEERLARQYQPHTQSLISRSLSYGAESTPVFSGGRVDSVRENSVDAFFSPVSPSQNDSRLKESLAAAQQRPSPSTILVPTTGPLFGHAGAPHKARSALISPSHPPLLIPAHASLDPHHLASTQLASTAEEAASRPLSRNVSSLHHHASHLSRKRTSAATGTKKTHTRRLRHVHKGGFIMFEPSGELENSGGDATSGGPRRPETGFAVSSSESPPSANGEEAAQEMTPKVTPPKRYYFEKPSSVEVYGRASYTDPNANFLRGLDEP